MHHRNAEQVARSRAARSRRTEAGRYTELRPDDPGRAAKAETQLATLDYGTYPVAQASPLPQPEQHEDEPWQIATPDTAAISLPTIEDSASIQLALIDVLRALAANQLDPKRAGLLLYGLQVAAANAKHVHISSCGIRSFTNTSDGIPLAPQEYGWEIEDIEEAYKEDEQAGLVRD